MFRVAGADDEVVRISHEVHPGAGFAVVPVPKAFVQFLFQTVQRQVCQYGRDDAALCKVKPYAK